MSLRHLVMTLVVVGGLGALAPAAAADSQPLERIQQQAQRMTPDGFQPQLRSSVGASSHPDNLVRPHAAVPTTRATSPTGGFDWDAGAVGLAAGVVLSALAAGAVAAGRTRRTLAQS